MILMSPPCQPFSRTGLKADVADPRSKSFLRFLQILPRMEHKPAYVFLENVVGFESSVARHDFTRTLELCRYTFREFHLSPTTVGVPNSRLRYFLLALLRPRVFTFPASSQMLQTFPPSRDDRDLVESDRDPVAGVGHSSCCEMSNSKNCFDKPGHSEIAVFMEPQNDTALALEKQEPTGSETFNGPCSHSVALYKRETQLELERKRKQEDNSHVRPLLEFLDGGDRGRGIEGYKEENTQRYDGGESLLLPDKVLLRYGDILDIVRPDNRRSMCFTKAYVHYVEGTGSVLQMADNIQLQDVFEGIDHLPEETRMARLRSLRLRYFSPSEISRLHGFFPTFGFPNDVTHRQRYRLLGNSLNVHLVAKLLQLLLDHGEEPCSPSAEGTTAGEEKVT
uniref:tRNA (cytosine(38)-C(5))-methyltransferase-like n=1 Tax=Myxine glutinosa TaxID=7769 RepID=UPI00358ED5F5